MGNVLAVRPEPVEGQLTKSTVNYNPDVLSCLANLSNDEVFTPPELVNQMLDMLPSDLWENQEAKFLDPVTKSGVFLREIAKRLNKGLAEQIPDKQARINHIFKHQLYGIAITELTSLLARRSLYCAKAANSARSVCDVFDDEQGNIRYQRIKHTWVGVDLGVKDSGKCSYCGASKKEYDREDDLENHAYQFIHTDNPQDLFGNDMRFDVIIGNPPYQLSTGGSGVQATPLYNKFVLQSKRLMPRFLTMITPSRWFSGGFGLDAFRDEMLTDNRLRVIHDYPEAADCFPGVQIKGGVSYFLWSRDHQGDCAVTTHRVDKVGATIERPLLEPNCDFFIRYNEAISVLHKVNRISTGSFEPLVSSQKPFGFATTFRGLKKQTKSTVTLHENGGTAYVEINTIGKNLALIQPYKVFIPRAGSGSDKFPHQILGRPFIGYPNSACTETYLTIGPLDSEVKCRNVISYIHTRFFRFLVMLLKPTQDALKKVYSLVPMQDFDESWTDEKLYKKYGLTQEEIDFIESMIRPMELSDE